MIGGPKGGFDLLWLARAFGVGRTTRIGQLARSAPNFFLALFGPKMANKASPRAALTLGHFPALTPGDSCKWVRTLLKGVGALNHIRL